MEALLGVESLVYTPRIKKKNQNAVRIAIVEDDPMFRHAMEYFLKKNPENRVFAFSSGEACLEHYHSLDPEILILDYKLNDVFEADRMNGLDVLRKIKSVKPETGVIFLSGQDSFDVATAAIKDGASEYIMKDAEALPKMLHEVSRMSFLIRERREQLKTLRLTIALSALAALLLVVAYYSGYENFSMLLNIMIIVVACSCVAVIVKLFRRKYSDKIKFGEKSERDERPGDWLD